jgi:hypothetical protein
MCRPGRISGRRVSSFRRARSLTTVTSARRPRALFRPLDRARVHERSEARASDVCPARGQARSRVWIAARAHSEMNVPNDAFPAIHAVCGALRAPMLLIGGTGPKSKARRRPWIDWIHTANSQGQWDLRKRNLRNGALARGSGAVSPVEARVGARRSGFTSSRRPRAVCRPLRQARDRSSRARGCHSERARRSRASLPAAHVGRSSPPHIAEATAM